MEIPRTIYTPEKQKQSAVENKPLNLTDQQKNIIRDITMGIDEVDEEIRSMAVEDVFRTLENGHPLNRIINGQNKEDIIGYIACEDFVPHEAYIKYLGTTKQTGRNMLQEIPAFLDFAKQQGYAKLNFHGWNERLNNVMERYGFERVRTDNFKDVGVDFYEKILVEQKSSEDIAKERMLAFEQKYLNKLNQEYGQTLATFSQESRQKKEQLIGDAFKVLSGMFLGVENFEFGDRQKGVLKLKLARFFQNNDMCDLNVLFDAIIESPKFINTDKGSLHRILEIHEEKTLQKIAEMRKKRAEMGDTETFNPYENLFTTKSGNYYMARLLNMPHLEEESRYMNHCVGTSDSYINKMKRGDVEILSFRSVPKRNQETGGTRGDIPVMTIEYNCRTNVIEQMKKYDDEYIKKDDPYFDDVIDALKQLRSTIAYSGELRNFSKISKSELENIKVSDYCILTEQGEIPFRDFDPESGIFILKFGNMEITSDISKGDVVKIIRIVGNFDFKLNQIAQNEKEITDETKIYIGPLFEGIFQKNIEHIYTSFPEGKLEKYNIEIGRKTKEQLEQQLKEQNIYVYDVAKDLMNSPDFVTSKNIENANLVRLTVKDLGFPNGATTDEIYQKAQDFGLELCPAEVGPQMRLQSKIKDWMIIAMKQIIRGGSLSVFRLRGGGDGLELRYGLAKPSRHWSGDYHFVFRLRKFET